MTAAVLRTLIVDDEPIARDRLRALCRDLPQVEVVGEAASGAEGLARLDVGRRPPAFGHRDAGW